MIDDIGSPSDHEAVGFKAGQNDWPRDACTHPEGSEAHSLWHQGYAAGQKAKALHAVADKSRRGPP